MTNPDYKLPNHELPHRERAATSPKKALVIIPTYNECDNVEAIVTAVLGITELATHVLVVDDNSPDGTAAIVTRMMAQEKRLFLLSRPGKQGLGRAYIDAFGWGLERGYEILVEMDADFSHRPEDLNKILSAANGVDFVMGSRWVRGGRTVNWGWFRKLVSRGGSLYTRLILGYSVADWTGGFNAWHGRVLLGIGLHTIVSNGYSFQIELKYRSLRKGFRGLEVPIVFEERRVGKSKMSSKIVVEALGRVWSMRFSR